MSRCAGSAGRSKRRSRRAHGRRRTFRDSPCTNLNPEPRARSCQRLSTQTHVDSPAPASAAWAGRPRRTRPRRRPARPRDWPGPASRETHGRASFRARARARPRSRRKPPGPLERADRRGETRDFGRDVAAGRHEVRQPQGQAIHENRPGGRAARGMKRPGERERLLPRRPAPAALGLVARDPRRHLLVARVPPSRDRGARAPRFPRASGRRRSSRSARRRGRARCGRRRQLRLHPTLP